MSKGYEPETRYYISYIFNEDDIEYVKKEFSGNYFVKEFINASHFSSKHDVRELVNEMKVNAANTGNFVVRSLTVTVNGFDIGEKL